MFPSARHAYLHRFTLAFLIVAALMLLLWLLNRPFYAGSRIASIGSWRLEHGRLTLNWGRPSTESFYIAINSEPVRWAAEFTPYSPGDWRIVVPLWLPMAASLALAGVCWRWQRRASRPPAAGSPPPVVNPSAPP